MTTHLRTASDVLAGIDLTGTTAVVTGGYSGLGLQTTLALSNAGARVVVPARRPEAARSALGGLRKVEVHQLDLADLASVDAFAERFLRVHHRLDLVVASAGLMACPETRVGPGWEAQLAINHLGHFALVNRLWPALAATGSARVVSVASGQGPASCIHWDDVQFERGYDKWEAYAQSKHANVLFARHLDRLGAPHGVRAFSVNPGYILTPLQRHLPVEEMVAAGWIDEQGNPAPGLFATPQQGAATQVWAATAPGLESHGGGYCLDCRVAEVDLADADDAARLWALSAGLTGGAAPAPPARDDA